MLNFVAFKKFVSKTYFQRKKCKLLLLEFPIACSAVFRETIDKSIHNRAHSKTTSVIMVIQCRLFINLNYSLIEVESPLAIKAISICRSIFGVDQGRISMLEETTMTVSWTGSAVWDAFHLTRIKCLKHPSWWKTAFHYFGIIGIICVHCNPLLFAVQKYHKYSKEFRNYTHC